jgi:hypothetical protein
MNKNEMEKHRRYRNLNMKLQTLNCGQMRKILKEMRQREAASLPILERFISDPSLIFALRSPRYVLTVQRSTWTKLSNTAANASIFALSSLGGQMQERRLS